MFNDTLNMAGSYYAATAHPAPEAPPLRGEIEADLVVVGGGCTGLSAALHAARRGQTVVVLEGGRVGWGASGRNGGQIIPGLRKGALELTRAFGAERARALFDLAVSARTLVLGLIEREGIDCDLETTGHLLAAVKGADLRHFEAEVECLASVMGYRDARVLDAGEMRGQVAAAYPAGLMDRGGGHLHPLNYTLGLAEAARRAGAVIHEQSLVASLEAGPRPTVRTREGAVTARNVLLAGDALLEGLAPTVNAAIMPVANYLVATAPLADPAAIIPGNAAVSDSRFVVNYYRLSADGRLIFGGGERYSRRPPADIAAFVRPYLERTFPQLRGVRIDHAWGGLVSITRTRLPHLGRRGPVWLAHGYSGMGVVLSTLAGKLAADAMAGEASDFDLFAGVAPPPFPGGESLRGPLHVLGMLWYALRDRL